MNKRIRNNYRHKAEAVTTGRRCPADKKDYKSTFDISVNSDTVIPNAVAIFARVSEDGLLLPRSIAPIEFLLIPQFSLRISWDQPLLIRSIFIFKQIFLFTILGSLDIITIILVDKIIIKQV